MKKKLLTLLCLLLLALCCAAVCLADSHVHSGGTATCDSLAVCSECGQAYGHLADHRWGSWVSDGASTHTRTCQTNPAHKETRYHMGGASTCTRGASCVLCGAVHDEPLGHVPALYAGYAPTCTSSGATDGEKCTRCGDVITPRRVISATGHSFSQWSPLGYDLHTAVCGTAGCGASTVIACTPYEVTMNGSVVTVCPICGACGNIVLPTLIAQADDALPMGQLLVRGAAQPFDGVYYAFTVTGSYAGQVVELDGVTTIYLPEELYAYPDFLLVRVDVTPASEQAGRTEHWTELPFRLVEGRLIFQADTAGLYLLISAE